MADRGPGRLAVPCGPINDVRGGVELAERLGADALVTGHYARTRDGLLRVAADAQKDQSYMLAALAPAAL